MDRKEIHLTLSAQISQMEITNNRLYLHESPLSQLEIDLMRKQAIEYYDMINRLALVAKQTVIVDEVAETPKEVIAEPVEIKKPEPKKAEKQKKAEAPKPKKKEKPIAQEKKEEKETVIEKLTNDQDSVADRFKNQKIDSVKAAISISKRFEFQKNLFDDDHVMYGKTLDYFSEARDLEEGLSRFTEMLEAHEWDEKDKLVIELKNLIHRRYA